MRLRSYLSTLTLLTLVPVALFAAVVGYFLIEHQRETMISAAGERALAMLTAVDAELKGSITSLEALAAVESLSDGNLRYFRRTAAGVLANRRDWVNINLALPDRQRMLDLIAAEDAALPPITDDGEIAVLLRERKPVMAGIAVGPVSKEWNFAVRVPVVREGQVRYVLSAVVRPDTVAGLVEANNLPAGWVAAVLDHNNRIVARTAEQEAYRGRLASQGMLDALAQAPSGWYRGSTREGLEIYTPYRRSDFSGWTFVLGVPASAVHAAAWRVAAVLGIGLLAAIALAFFLAHVFGKHLSAPLAALAAAAGAVGRGERVAMPQTDAILEVRSLARTLQQCLDSMREREERLRMALDAGRMGSWEWNVRTNEVKWSPELEAIHGLAAGAFGGTFAAFEKDVHPEDVAKVRSEVARSMEPGRSEHHIEYRIVRPDGEVRWVEGRGRVLRDESGAPLRLIGVCTDVTHRKAAEETLRTRTQELQTILDTAPVQIWLADAECKRIVGNRAGYEQHGLPYDVNASFDATPPELQKGLKLVANGRELAPHELPMQVAARTGQPVVGFEHDVIHPDGRRITMWANATPVKDEAGKVRSVVGVFLDITQRKQAEQALKDADRAKDEFLAMLSHELRNPLAALTTAAHVLRASNPAGAAAAQARGVVERQVDHMARLVEDLLDISRITLGKVALREDVFDLAAMASGLVAAWRDAGRFAEHRLSVDGLPAWVRADRVRMEQVLSNLLHNALKFTPAGGYVSVGVREERGEAVLEVSDSGRGIAPEMLDRVFEPFTQAAHTLHRAEGGLGLGLALVKRLAELHGGSASAQSAGAGQGAAFTVRLPAVAAPRQRAGRAAIAEPEARARRRILVIEDNADARAMLCATLMLNGHEVSEASSGQAGLAAASRAQPDVALIDIGLPDIDGYEVARRLRSCSDSAHMGLVALTGYGQDDDLIRARDAGFDVHLTKPVAPERLEQIIAGLQ